MRAPVAVAIMVLTLGCNDELPSIPPLPDFTVTRVRPDVGPPSGGTIVGIVGSGFREGTVVTFGGKRATNVRVVRNSWLTAVTPPHPAGPVDIRLLHSYGQEIVLPGRFTYAESDEPGAGAWDY